MSATPSIFNRSPREGGYVFVTAPAFTGFSFMLKPGEDDTEMNQCFIDFLAVVILQAARRSNASKIGDRGMCSHLVPLNQHCDACADDAQQPSGPER